MSILTRVPDAVVVPTGLPELLPARSSAVLAAGVAVGDSAESLVPVPERFGTLVPYDDLPLSPRGPLVLRAGVVARLERVADALPSPFGIAVLDGWRSPEYQSELLGYYRARFPDLEAGYVADPADAHVLAPHTTGGAVDLTLSWNGLPLALGTDYDSFADAAHVAALEDDGSADSSARELRRLLASVLRDAGFAPYPLEWWHWSYGDQWWAAEYGERVSLYPQITG